MEKLEDITHSMRQWVERIGPIPSHEIVASVFDWARRIEACKNEVKPCTNAARLRQALIAIAYRNVAGKPSALALGGIAHSSHYIMKYALAFRGRFVV